MNFDETIERRGTHSMKWDMMEDRYGVPADTGIPMWVADMDFRAPACVSAALERMTAQGIYGYYGDDRAYNAAIGWWMRERHDWTIESDWILTTHGLVNATGLCVQTWTSPGDAVVLFTPVYHAFARVIRSAGREVRECPLVARDGRMTMDFARYDRQMTGREKMVILCSPHNPGGQVWTAEELRGVADFARRHGLILVSDEIHHDLVMPGNRHITMPLAEPGILDRLVMLTSSSKTFNLAGAHTGNVIIPDPALRKAFAQTMAGLGISANSFGIEMAAAAYSPEGAAWVDALCAYLDGNRAIFEKGIEAIPGLHVTPLQATYLEWVDFAGTGMDMAEVRRRVEQGARIAANHGETFGAGGETFLRFNIAAPRTRVIESVERLQRAFGDLQ